MRTKIFSRFSAAGIGLLLSAHAAIAQGISGERALTTAESQLRTLITPLLNVVSILVGVVGVVFVAINLLKYLKSQQQDSDNSLLKVGAGLIIAAILIQVIKAVALT